MHELRPQRLLPWLLCAGFLAGPGCDRGEPAPEPAANGDAKATPANGATTPADGDAKAGDAKAAAGGAETPPTEAEAEKQAVQFLKDQRKKGCEMLTPAMVAKVLEVPEDQLDQKKIMGCIYSWEAEGQTAEASISSIWIKKTPESAKTWFENSTKNLTAEQLAEQMAKVTAKAKEREEIDTKIEKKTVDTVGGVMAGMTPDEGYRYEDVADVGDEARVKTYDGSVSVRVGNMLFSVRAYKGTPAPPPDMEAMMSRDIKKITAAAKKAEAAFMEKTRDVRRTLSTALAKEVVGALP